MASPRVRSSALVLGSLCLVAGILSFLVDINRIWTALLLALGALGAVFFVLDA